MSLVTNPAPSIQIPTRPTTLTSIASNPINNSHEIDLFFCDSPSSQLPFDS